MTDLRQAAQAVLDRWDSPRWEWDKQGPTADLMATLREALEQPEQDQTAEAIHAAWSAGFVEGEKAALEQPEQELVALTLDSAPLGTKAPAFGGGAWTKTESGWKWNSGSTFPRPGGDWTGRLILPAAQRPWVGLTDEEIADEFYKFESAGAWYQFTRAIEAKLKERNT